MPMRRLVRPFICAMVMALYGCSPSARAPIPTKPKLIQQVVPPRGELRAAFRTSPYDEFWEAFRTDHERFRQAIRTDMMGTLQADPMLDRLHLIHEDLHYELAEEVDGVQTVVFTTGGLVGIFAHVEALVAAAPYIKGWNFIAFRQPAYHPEAMHIRIYGQDLTLDGVRYRSQPDGGKTGIYLSMPGFTALSPRPDEGVYLLLDHLLGEHTVERKIGFIELENPGDEASATKPIIELRAELGVPG